jgi:hypothetical protein
MKLVAISFAIGLAGMWTADASRPTTVAQSTPDVVLRGRIYVNIPRQSLSTFVSTCSDLVHARVDSVEAVFPNAGLPYRNVELDVIGDLKRTTTSKLSIQIVGASDATHDFKADRSPELKPGQEVVLFLWSDPMTNVTGILGLADGTYQVQGAGADATVTGLYAYEMSIPLFFQEAFELWSK